MYKLISLDLDGTLFNKDDQISERNYDALLLCQQMNIETIVATGRPPRSTFRDLPEILSGEYVITYNGGRIYKDKQLIYETSIKVDLVSEILTYLESLDSEIKIALDVDDQLYSNFNVKKHWPWVCFDYINTLKSYKNTYKIIILNNSLLALDNLKAQFSNACNILQTDGGRLIEIMAKDVCKFKAVQWVIDRMEIDMSEVIAFGDDDNDIEVIAGAGLGVAMANGSIGVKAVADEITLENDCDGVAIVLERICEVSND